MRTPNRSLVELVRRLPKVDAHNRLMRLTDREIALAMMYMENPDRSYLMALLPPAKVRRIREELLLQERLTIRYDQYVSAVQSVLDGLTENGSGQRFRSYLRPRRTSR